MKRFVVFAFIVAAGASAGAARVSASLTGLDTDTPIDVIVRFRSAPTAAHHQRLRSKGAAHRSNLDLIDSAVYRIPARAAAQLASDPDVLFVAPDRPVRATLEFAEPAVNANIALQYGYDGANIGVAVIDSGISTAEDLKNSKSSMRVPYQQSFVQGEGSNDHYGHGQHVAGIIAGNGKRSSGDQAIHTFRGIAPNANIINLKALDANGAGSDSQVIAAIQQAIALKAKYNIRVINLSLGRPVFESYTQDPLCQAVSKPGRPESWWWWPPATRAVITR